MALRSISFDATDGVDGSLLMRKQEWNVTWFFSREGALPYKKNGVLVGNFKKNPLEVPRSCFVGVAQNVFHP